MQEILDLWGSLGCSSGPRVVDVRRCGPGIRCMSSATRRAQVALPCSVAAAIVFVSVEEVVSVFDAETGKRSSVFDS